MIGLIKASYSILRQIMKRKEKPKDTAAEIIEKSIESKDKLLFQPNLVNAKTALEYPINRNIQTTEPTGFPQLPPGKTTETSHSITVECNQQAISHMESLCRFFELSQPEAIARGIWLLTLARDIEIANKKLGVISVDNNGLIVEVTPVNVV